MQLFADEDFPLPAVQRLRSLGHDVVTAIEAGIGNDETPDDQVLALAIQLNRALLTHNRRHFKLLHAKDSRHAGIIACTHDRDFIRLADRVHEAIGVVPSLAGQWITVVRPHVRP